MVDWTGLQVTALLLITAAGHGGETEQEFRANSQSKLVQSKLSSVMDDITFNGPLHPQTALHFVDLFISSSI